VVKRAPAFASFCRLGIGGLVCGDAGSWMRPSISSLKRLRHANGSRGGARTGVKG
jgi:hypothetical protein